MVFGDNLTNKHVANEQARLREASLAQLNAQLAAEAARLRRQIAQMQDAARRDREEDERRAAYYSRELAARALLDLHYYGH